MNSLTFDFSSKGCGVYGECEEKNNNKSRFNEQLFFEQKLVFDSLCSVD